MGSALEFNLLPREYQKTTEMREVYVSVGVSIALVVGVCASLASVAAGIDHARAESKRSVVRQSYEARLGKLRATEASLRARGLHLEQIVSQRAMGTGMLVQLASIFKGRGWLSQLKYDAASQLLTITGYALKTRDIPDFMASMWQMRTLTDIRTVAVNRTEMKGQDLIAFVLSAKPISKSGESPLTQLGSIGETANRASPPPPAALLASGVEP